MNESERRMRAAAVDDEPLALELLREYADLVPILDLRETFLKPEDLLEYLRKEQIDLVFLDIEMPDLSGNRLAAMLPEHTRVVFTTAYDDYAAEAFDLDAADYLVKPIEFERFHRAVEKARKQRDTWKRKTAGTGDALFVKSEYRLERVALGDILFVEGMRDYLCIHTPKKRVMTLMSFRALMEQLPQDRFCRVHRSYVVSLSQVELVQRGEIVIGEHVIPIGETYRKSFMDRIRS